MKTKKQKDFGLIFFIHLFLIILFYLSPFLVNWKIVTLTVVLILLQYKFLGDCIFTKAEFKDKDKGFFEHYLKKIGINISKKQVDFLSIYVVPILLPLAAIIWQVLLKHKPLWF